MEIILSFCILISALIFSWLLGCRIDRIGIDYENNRNWQDLYEYSCNYVDRNKRNACNILSITFDDFIKIHKVLPGVFTVLKHPSDYLDEAGDYYVIKGHKKNGESFYVTFPNWKDYKKFCEYIEKEKEQEQKEKEMREQSEILSYLLDEIKQKQQEALNTINSCKNKLKEMNANEN